MSPPRGTFPPGLAVTRRTPVFDQDTIPAGLRRAHRTAAGVWGLIRIVEGRLRYRTIEPDAEQILDPQHCATIAPGCVHEVEPLGPVRFFVEFYADPANGERNAAAAQDPEDRAGPHG